MTNRQSTIVSSQSKGFTLIELLVVIAIISLLVSILLPSLNRAKGLARRVVCMTNMRQIGIAEHVYAGDNSGCFASSWDGNGYYGPPDTVVWQTKLVPYLGAERHRDAKVFECPDWEPWGGRDEDGCPLGNIRAYGGNWCMAKAEWRYKRSIVPQPSETVLVGEINGNTDGLYTRITADPPPSEEPNVATYYRLSHLGGGTANYLMVDGRVESLEGVRFADDTDEDYPVYEWWGEYQ